MKNLLLFFLSLLLVPQISFSQDFTFKISTESPSYQVSFPAEPELKNIEEKQYVALQYSVLYKNTAYSFSVLTIPDSIEDKKICNEFHSCSF